MNDRLGEWGDHITLQAASDRVIFLFVSVFTALVLIVKMYLNDLSFVLVSSALVLLMFFFPLSSLLHVLCFICMLHEIGNTLAHPREGM